MGRINCYTCRDEGRVGGCPECGKQKIRHFASNIQVLADPNKIKLTIPKDYINNFWDSMRLRNTHEVPPSTKAYFDNYVTQLDRLLSKFKEGMIPQMSGIILSYHSMGKTVFAYSCLQYAQSRGLNIFPLLDAVELQSMVRDWDMGKTSDLASLLNVTRMDYLSCDILFIKIPNDKQKRNHCGDFILDVFDSRARRGQPTYLISSYRLEDLAPNGVESSLKNLRNKSENVDRLKYPIIVDCMFKFDNLGNM